MTLIPVQVTFRGLPHFDAVESDIRDRVRWLEQFYTGMVRCHVVVELPHRHRHEGRQFHVRIEMTVPGGPPIVVTHESTLHGRLKDVQEDSAHKAADLDGTHRYAHVAVREAFDVARRRLEDFARTQRNDVKSHLVPAQGEVVEISPIDGYGYIQAGEDRIYFQRESVLDNAFARLTVGAQVAFLQEQGDKGPQATTVRVLGKHHYVSH